MPPRKELAVRFVLVRPSNALNMGAAARAMANFGFGDLRAVAPYALGWRRAKSGIYGSEILSRAKVTSLEKAVADCRLVLGAASAHNRALRRTMVTLPAVPAWIRRRLADGGRIAVLFGSERSGLSNAELDHCHALLRIPTSIGAPSMNLGQAVAVTAYALAESRLERNVRDPEETPPESAQLETLTDAALRAMAAAGVNRHLGSAQRRAKFRRGLLKWNLSREDASFLTGLFSRLARTRIPNPRRRD